jgi:DNA-binding NarL/FixJ family response regulator
MLGGIEALRTIKQGTTAKVIVLAAYPYPQYREKCLCLSADYFSNKADEFDQIVCILDQMKRESL